MRDERPDALLEVCGRVAWRLGLALAWTDSLEGEEAKTCSRNGSAAWKHAQRLPDDENVAAGLFKKRARKRNPAVVASRSDLVLIEFDADLVELCARFDVWGLPGTVRVRSRRGAHLYYSPPAGRTPMKVQIASAGVTVSDDGYLIGAGALHPTSHVYEYISSDAISVLPVETYDLLRELHDKTSAELSEKIARGEPVDEGARHFVVFNAALKALRQGMSSEQALEQALRANEQQCVPPYSERVVRKHWRGALKVAAAHPTETERARTAARRVLRERRSGATDVGNKPWSKRKRELRRQTLGSIAARRVEYLMRPWVPVGVLMLLAGVGGLGKSALLHAWAAQWTQAGLDVLIVSYEDSVEQVLRPRAEALGADLERMHVLSVDLLDGGISFPTDLPELDRHVRETRAAAVLIDPVSPSIDLALDAHREQDVRVVLGRLAKMAEREQVAVLMNAHLNKQLSGDVYVRVNGSTAFYNGARSVATVTPDPADPDWLRLVAHHKSNYGPLADVERWRVVPLTIPSETGPIDTMKLEFIEIADDVSREDVLAKPLARSLPLDKLDQAVEWLTDMLSDGDWHDSAGLVTLAAGRISERTMRRAALEQLQVEHERRGFPSTTWWRLPSHASSTTKDLA